MSGFLLILRLGVLITAVTEDIAAIVGTPTIINGNSVTLEDVLDKDFPFLSFALLKTVLLLNLLLCTLLQLVLR